MPSFHQQQISPPKNWQDFEELAADLWTEIFQSKNTCLHGRSGQAQYGVDVFGHASDDWFGVQCKGKDARYGNALSEGELMDEVKKAKDFKPPLDQFILATTAPNDEKIQEAARKLTELHKQKGLFTVSVWGWDDIQRALSQYPLLIAKHYPGHRIQSYNSINTTYLKGILLNIEEFQQGYIDLATKAKIQATQTNNHNSGRSFIAPSFSVIDKCLNPSQNESSTLESIGEVYALQNRFVLLGSPGAGKSLSMEKLLLDSAKQAMENTDALIPILINLAEWPDDVDHISEFIHLHLKTKGLPLIPFNHLLILLDGLNEVPSKYYIERVKQLDYWLKTHVDVSVIISCRQKHYQNNKKLEIPTVLIKPFDSRRIQLFLDSHLGKDAAVDILPQLGPIDKTLRTPRDLIHLARNPFFLALICHVYKIKNHLPNSRGQLFQVFVETLFNREQQMKTTQGLTQADLIQGLCTIAFAMQQKRSATSVHTDWAEKQLSNNMESEAIIDLAREASLVRLVKDGKEFQFSHQLILEYFVAEGLLLRLEKLGKYVKKPGFARNQRKGAAWDEVVYTLAGIAEPNRLLNELAAIDPFLAVECFDYLTDKSALDDQTLRIIIKSLIAFFDSQSLEARIAAVNTLIIIGAVVIPYLAFELSRSKNPAVRKLCLQVLMNFRQVDSHKAIALAMLDKKKWVRREASDYIETFNETEVDELFEVLLYQFKQKNQQSKKLINEIFINASVSKQSINNFFGKCLTYGYLYEDILPVFNSENTKTKILLIEALQVLNYEGVEEILLSAYAYLLGNKSVRTRINAIKSFQTSGDEGLVVQFILALGDEHSGVRIAAIRALLEFDCDSFVKKTVLHLDDIYSNVRVATIQMLQKIGFEKLPEKILPFLDDTNSDVRISVIKVLQECEFEGLIEKILPCLHDNVPEVVAATINTLREVKYDGLEAIVCQILNEKAPPLVRAATFLVLFELDSKFMKDQVCLALNDKVTYIRIIATCIYMASKPSQITKEQITAFSKDVRNSITSLKSKKRTIRMTRIQVILLYAISQLNDIKLIDQYLIPKLSHQNPSVRRVAVLALSRANLQNFKELVIPMLKDKNRMVRRVVEQEIAKLV